MFLGRREGGEEKSWCSRSLPSFVPRSNRSGRRFILGYATIRSIESVITRAGQRKSRKNSGYGVGEKEVAAVDVALLAEGRGMED